LQGEGKKGFDRLTETAIGVREKGGKAYLIRKREKERKDSLGTEHCGREEIRCNEKVKGKTISIAPNRARGRKGKAARSATV